VADEVADLVVVVVDVLLVDILTWIYIETEDLNLLLRAFLHRDHVHSATELLSFVRKDVVHRLSYQKRSIVDIS